jgi:WW domain
MSQPQPKPSDAYDAFNAVDQLVSKSILGSDGAASWQEFRNNNRKTIYNKVSTAPLAPLKKADKLGTGLASWDEERKREEQVRKDGGYDALGTGYTTFKAKTEDPQVRKERKRIEARRRPDNAEYFIPAKTFAGWKFDYIFTTKDDRGTGYYWDGMDSLKKLKGELPAVAGPGNLVTNSTAPAAEEDNQHNDDDEDEQAATGKHERSSNDLEEEESKPKKKKKRKKSAPVIIDDPNNPLEQVQEAIRKRNMRLGLGSEGLAEGWEAAPDPSTGKIYYFHRQSGTRQWERPKNSNVESLPEGWSVAQDKNTGKEYYYHTSGETRWEKPQ